MHPNKWRQPSPSPPRRSQRLSEGSKPNVNYLATYHPLDEVTRPKKARAQRHSKGLFSQQKEVIPNSSSPAVATESDTASHRSNDSEASSESPALSEPSVLPDLALDGSPLAVDDQPGAQIDSQAIAMDELRRSSLSARISPVPLSLSAGMSPVTNHGPFHGSILPGYEDDAAMALDDPMPTPLPTVKVCQEVEMDIESYARFYQKAWEDLRSVNDKISDFGRTYHSSWESLGSSTDRHLNSIDLEALFNTNSANQSEPAYPRNQSIFDGLDERIFAAVDGYIRYCSSHEGTPDTSDFDSPRQSSSQNTWEREESGRAKKVARSSASGEISTGGFTAMNRK